MTERAGIIAGIASALHEVLQYDQAHALPELTEDTRLFDDLGLESASVLELLMIIEDTMGIEVDANELDIDDLRSVRSFADFVQSRQSVATEGVA